MVSLPCSRCRAAAVALYHTLHGHQLLPSWLPGLPVIPIEPFQLTSFALSLLLVFRTNSSYSRWYEGRRRFGRITTTCRDICRQVGRWAEGFAAAARVSIQQCEAGVHTRNGQKLQLVTACIYGSEDLTFRDRKALQGLCSKQSSCLLTDRSTSQQLNAVQGGSGCVQQYLTCCSSFAHAASDAGTHPPDQQVVSSPHGSLADCLLSCQQVVHP